MTIELVVSPTTDPKIYEPTKKVPIVKRANELSANNPLRFCPKYIAAGKSNKKPSPVINPLSLFVNSFVRMHKTVQAVLRVKKIMTVLKKAFLLKIRSVICLRTTHKFTSSKHNFLKNE